MKTIQLLLICLLISCCHACHNRPYPHTMQVADTLVYSNPDSAIMLLAQLKDSINAEPEAAQMYYRLLTVKAKDKAYITHSSDSLILQALYYYEENNDEKHLPEAYYYAGRVYSDLGDAPQALAYYQKAAELLEGSTNYQLLKVVYSQMGDLFLYQDVYEEAMEAFKKAYYYNALLKDDRGMIINLRNIGHAFTACNNIDSAQYYYQTAYEAAKKADNQSLIDISLNTLSAFYIQTAKYSLAQNLLDIQKIKDSPNNYILFATLYHQTGKLDSASFYYKKLLNSDNIYTQQAVHWGLAEIAQEQSDSKTAIKHIKQYSIWSDSIRKITNSETIRKMQSHYNYQLREKKNNKLEAKNTEQRFWNIFVLLILLIVSLIFLIYHSKAQLRKSQLQNSLKELERLKKEIQANRKEYELDIANFKQSEIYSKFHTVQGFERLEETDWMELQNAINKTYKNFTHHLYSLYPISKIELRICLLIKTDISISHIALLTGRSKSAITSARRKLYEKVYGQKGGPEMWDQFILSL